MSDDGQTHVRVKDWATGIAGTGKTVLGRLLPASITSDDQAERSTSGGRVTSRDSAGSRKQGAPTAVDRRTYLLLAGSVGTASVTGLLGGATTSATATNVAQPDGYGAKPYGVE